MRVEDKELGAHLIASARVNRLSPYLCNDERDKETQVEAGVYGSRGWNRRGKNMEP